MRPATGVRPVSAGIASTGHALTRQLLRMVPSRAVSFSFASPPVAHASFHPLPISCRLNILATFPPASVVRRPGHQFFLFRITSLSTVKPITEFSP